MNSSDDEMPEMIITGEVRDARDREVVSEIVIPALKSLAGSLDIPVTLRAS